MSFPLRHSPGSLLAPSAPAPALTACYTNHLPPNHLNDHLGPPSILPRCTPLLWPPVLIRPPLDHTFIVGGLALTMTSMSCLVISVAGCLLVRWP